MKDIDLADTIYDDINQNRYFSACTHTLDSNVIEVTDKENIKHLVTIGEPSFFPKLRDWINEEIRIITELKKADKINSLSRDTKIKAMEERARTVLKMIGE